jgi:pilus assembly protein CpaB
MRRNARLVVAAIAVFAALIAAYLVSGLPDKSQVALPAAERGPGPPTFDVLLATGELQVGTVVGPQHINWRPWPADAASPHLIRKNDRPNAKEEFLNSIVRVGLLDGEPVRVEKLVKADGSGFMSAILPAGMRAMAITIDSRGTNSAGGFILPNDRVDVIRTFRNDAASKTAGTESFDTETILSNIRVLAIGQKVQEGSNGERYVTGETATLELDLTQVETIAFAQRSGSISLALRSMVDRQEPPGYGREKREKEAAMTIVRFGVSEQSSTK